MSLRRSSPHTRIAPAAAYTAAVLFALHLATYFVASVRDATRRSQPPRPSRLRWLRWPSRSISSCSL